MAFGALYHSMEQLSEKLREDDPKTTLASLEMDANSFKEHLDEYLAQRLTNSMYSNEPEIKVLDKEGNLHKKATDALLRELDNQDYYNILRSVSTEASLSGICGILIKPTYKKIHLIPVSTRHMFLPTFDEYGDMIYLELTRKLFSGARPYFSQETYTKYEIIKKYGSSTDDLKDFASFNKETDLFEESDYTGIDKHNLGEVPITIISNKVYTPHMLGENPELFFKAMATSYIAQPLIPRLLAIWKMKGIEIHRGRTMLINKEGVPDITTETLKNKMDSFNNSDMIAYLDGETEYVGGNFEQLGHLDAEWKSTVGEFWRRVFVSTHSSLTGKNQKNDLEIYQGSREEVQYVENRVAIQQKQIKQNLELFAKAHRKYISNSPFKEGQEIVVNIITNEVRDSIQMAETFGMLVEKGVMPRREAVKKILSIGEKDAQEISERALKEFEGVNKSLKPPQTPNKEQKESKTKKED